MSFFRSSLEYNQFGCSSNPYLGTASGIQLHNTNNAVTLSDDDSFSTTSWEEEEITSEVEEEGSASEDDDEFKAPVKYTPKIYKKSIHPLSSKKTAKYEQEIQQCQPILNHLFINSDSHLPQAPPRPTATPTIYQKLTKANIDWCRYCGTTEGVNWRPGPWGKRTLCK